MDAPPSASQEEAVQQPLTAQQQEEVLKYEREQQRKQFEQALQKSITTVWRCAEITHDFQATMQPELNSKM